MKSVIAAPGYGWGYNNRGQVGNNSAVNSSSPSLIFGDLKFVHIATSGNHTIGVTEDGSAYAWGYNSHGQLGIGNEDNKSTPSLISGGLKFIATTAMYNGTSFGLTEGGDVYAWGDNSNGYFGDGTYDSSSTPVLVVDDMEFSMIYAGWGHVLALTEDGDAYAWGYNGEGQLGNNNTDDSLTPVLVNGGLKFTSVHAGGSNSFGITEDGTAYAWGENYDGSLGVDSYSSESTPTVIYGDLLFSMIAPGDYHTIGLTKDGDVYGWGSNWDGELGAGAAYYGNITPVKIEVSEKCTAVAAGFGVSFAIAESNTGYAWGSNYSGELGAVSHGSSISSTNTPVVIGDDMEFSFLTANTNTVFGILKVDSMTVRITCFDGETPTNPDDYAVKLWNGSEWGEISGSAEIISDGIVDVVLIEDELDNDVISVCVTSSNLEDQIEHFYIDKAWTKERMNNLNSPLSSREVKGEYSELMDNLDDFVSSISEYDEVNHVVRIVDQDGNIFASKDEIKDAVINADLSGYEETSADGERFGDLIVSTRAGVVGKMDIKGKVMTFYGIDGDVPIFTARLDDSASPEERGKPLSIE